MFDREYRFKGSHAKKINALTSPFSETEKNLKMFKFAIEAFVNAAIVGFLYGRKAVSDNEKKEDGSTYDSHIFADQMRNHREDCLFAYRLIALGDENFESDSKERLKLAFESELIEEADENEDTEEEKLFRQKVKSCKENFESYILGGIDFMYEKVIAHSENADEFIKNLNEFLFNFNEDFNKELNLEELEKNYGRN